MTLTLNIPNNRYILDVCKILFLNRLGTVQVMVFVKGQEYALE